MSYWGYPIYVSVAEKKAKAAKKFKQLQKKNPGLRPISIEGRLIARTWWGKSWNLNLERYADYSNRIGRGRSYVRHGAVLDLQIDSGRVEALVQGSRSRPYSVSIKIKAVSKKVWQEIKTACEGKLDSLQELLTGKFPKALGEIFTARGEGLFPSPEEIEFDCSCPDWAYMCKHVAATLYGIGARLDEDPGLFFKLRKVKMADLITQAVEDKTQKLLKKAEKKSARVIAESDIADVFGIDMEENIDLDLSKTAVKTRAGKKPGRSSHAASRLKKSAKPAAVKTPAKKLSAGKKTAKLSDTAQIINIIKRSKKGGNVAFLKQETGFDEKKIRNVIFNAFKKGIIKRTGRGIYRGMGKTERRYVDK